MSARNSHGESKVKDARLHIAATFVSEEAQNVHPAFGGSPQYNSKSRQFQLPMPYKNLALALQEYVPLKLGKTLGINASEEAWQALFDDINRAEEEAHGAESGPLAIFNKLVLKIGENRDVIDPWVSLIPDSYGLAVVKSAIAIILNFAEWRAEKRQSIFDALVGIRNVIGNANSKRKSFQDDPNVSKCASNLYDAIVGAIEEIFQSLPAKKSKSFEWARFIPRLKSKEKRKKKEDPLVILERVENSAEELDRAVNECRDHIIGQTERLSRDTNDQVAILVGWVVTEADGIIKCTNSKVGQIQVKVDKVYDTVVSQGKESREKQDDTTRVLKKRMKQLHVDIGIMKDRLTADNELFEMLLVEMGKKYSRVWRGLRALNEPARRQEPKDAPTAATSKAVVSLFRLFEIMCQPVPGQKNFNAPAADVESMLEHLNDDLETVVRRRPRLGIQAQGQAESLLQHARFLAWMESRYSDLLLVDGNTPSSREKVSAMSLFCANFVLSMDNLEPHDVYISFICGLHCSPMDPWPGPAGLLQSMIVQLLTALDARERLSLGFLSRQSYVRELEEAVLSRLCKVLRHLVRQFSPETTVYCVIDGISFFDVSDYHADLRLLVRCLKRIATDNKLAPKFKVMMTVPTKSPLQLRELVEDDQYVFLALRPSNPRLLTGRAMEARLSRRSTPSPNPSVRKAWGGSQTGYSTSDSDDDEDEEEEDDDDDEDDEDEDESDD